MHALCAARAPASKLQFLSESRSPPRATRARALTASALACRAPPPDPSAAARPASPRAARGSAGRRDGGARSTGSRGRPWTAGSWRSMSRCLPRHDARGHVSRVGARACHETCSCFGDAGGCGRAGKGMGTSCGRGGQGGAAGLVGAARSAGRAAGRTWKRLRIRFRGRRSWPDGRGGVHTRSGVTCSHRSLIFEPAAVDFVHSSPFFLKYC